MANHFRFTFDLYYHSSFRILICYSLIILRLVMSHRLTLNIKSERWTERSFNGRCLTFRDISIGLYLLVSWVLIWWTRRIYVIIEYFNNDWFLLIQSREKGTVRRDRRWWSNWRKMWTSWNNAISIDTSSKWFIFSVAGSHQWFFFPEERSKFRSTHWSQGDAVRRELFDLNTDCDAPFSRWKIVSRSLH